MLYITKNLHYPDNARENNVQGRVVVRFLVGLDGTVSNTAVIRGIEAGCNEESLRVVAQLPPWLPATYKGKPVKSYCTIPILFKLE